MLRALGPFGALAASVLCLSCSSSNSGTDSSGNTAPPKANERIGEIHQNDTWKDGYKLTGVVEIFEGATVEIEPGARIACTTPAVQIQIGGTLRVKGGGARTVITCNDWRGLLVAQHGTVDVTGLDIVNAETGIETTNGAGSVTLNDTTITNSQRPFTVREKSTLNLSHVTATTPTTADVNNISISQVFGTLVASYLHYEANTNEGVMVEHGGSADISDSTMEAKNGYDLISSYGGTSLKVSYTTMTGAHCGIHLGPAHDDNQTVTGTLSVDHVTSETNLFGITIYAASTSGPHSVKDSNFAGANSWIDLQGDHGPIDFEGNHVTGHANIIPTATSLPPTFNTPATAEVGDAKPH
jgi:hypothetical protein